jgi:hypothetical protein
MKILITFLGWLAWNFGELSFTKDEYDDAGKKFPFQEFIEKNWDNWIWNAIVAVILLVLGHNVFHIINVFEPIDVLKWGDAYLLVSGFVAQSAKLAYRKWKKLKSE